MQIWERVQVVSLKARHPSHWSACLSPLVLDSSHLRLPSCCFFYHRMQHRIQLNGHSNPKRCHLNLATVLSVWLLYLNHSINFYLYIISGKQFKWEHLLCCTSKMWLERNMKVSHLLKGQSWTYDCISALSIILFLLKLFYRVCSDQRLSEAQFGIA